MTTPKRYDLKQVIEQEKGKAEGIEIAVGRKTITVPPPILWPDAAISAFADNDFLTAAQALLGDDYEAFVGAGGTALLLFNILKDHQGVSPGESPASTDS